MKTKQFTWSLLDTKEEQRYCPNCGKVVVFKDSTKRRQNANGKNIYEYAIYKCDKEHTWNKKIRTYKARNFEQEDSTFTNYRLEDSFAHGHRLEDSAPERIDLDQLFGQGIAGVQIRFERVEGRHRLDKLVSTQVVELSRSAVTELLQTGTIQVNWGLVKPSYIIRADDLLSFPIPLF